MSHEEFRDSCVVGKDVCWPGLNLSEHLRVKVFDGIGRVSKFSNLRTSVNVIVKSDAAFNGARLCVPPCPALPARLFRHANVRRLATIMRTLASQKASA